MRMGNLKIVFAGSVGAGKTTAIQSVSDVEVVQTDEIATDEVQQMKAKTTVAMDYGQMNLEENTLLHLYGAPGQGRFDFMWEILSLGALGVIVLIDSASSDPFAQIDTYIAGFEQQLREGNMVIGLSRTDLNEQFQLDEYRSYICRHDPGIPLLTVDTRERQQVKILVKTLLYRIDPWLV
jgi:uncharacterized protein